MKFEIIMKYKLLIIIFIFPILCYITRKISPSLNSYTFKDFNDKSFFGKSEIIPKNSTKIDELTISHYNNIRIFTNINYNKIKLYFKLTNDEYYDSNRIEFEINLNNNISLINNKNISIYSSMGKNFKYILFKEYKDTSFFSTKNEYLLKNISLKYIKNIKGLECQLFFEDFDLILNLKKERLSFKIFYLFEILTDIIVYILIEMKMIYFENNLQNISLLFLLFIRIKIVKSFIYNFIDLFKIGIPITKILIFYFHLLVYGECLLSITNIITSIITFLFLIISIYYIIIIKYNDRNYFYCFNNCLIEGKIVPKKNNIKIIKQYLPVIIIYYNISYFCNLKSIYKQFIPLFLSIISAIVKHLLQREIMCKKDNEFCISFYFYGIIIYTYYLFKYNVGKFYRIKPTYSITPFIIVFLLYKILEYIIKNEYKIKYIMKEDFEKLKKIDKDCCSICLKNFDYNIENENKYFCKVSEFDNIHKTKCNHYFHEKCLFIWRKYKNICPICKKLLEIPHYYYFYDYTTRIIKWSWKREL